MSRKDYQAFVAVILGNALGTAFLEGGESLRTHVYNTLYSPAVAVFAADNPSFDESRFAFATAKIECDFVGRNRGL